VSALLEVRGISVRFGGLQALDCVSFDVPGTGVTAVIGPNGAGKTTLFNTISGLQVPDSGSVTFDGDNLTRRPAFARAGMGRTFQIVALFGEMTVLENVLVGFQRRFRGGLAAAALGSRALARQERAAQADARALLDRMGLTRFASRPAASLPLGQQRLVELARALASDPKLLLLDEPASGLSPAELEDMVRQIDALQRENRAVLLVEHNMRFVNRTAGHLIVLDYGKVIFEGLPLEGMRHNAVIDAYLGMATRA
jgi:branched-chain amino acid transport system ATP-binding protein